MQLTKKIVTSAIPNLFAKYLPILSHLNILSVLYIAVRLIKTFVFVESTYFGLKLPLRKASQGLFRTSNQAGKLLSHLLCNFCCKVFFLLFHTFASLKTYKLLDGNLSAVCLSNFFYILTNCLLAVFSLYINLI